MPNDLPLDVTTSNGKIDVVGITGNCQAKTNNGGVRLVAATESIVAETDNGEIRIESPAKSVRISTTNGGVRKLDESRRGQWKNQIQQWRDPRGAGQNRQCRPQMFDQSRQHSE